MLLIFPLTASVKAQCDFNTNATASGDTLHCNGGDNYKTIVAYNPKDSIYYSINAGGQTANEYYDKNGTYLGSSTSADFRGLWYNSDLEVMEGNSWNYYFQIDNLTPEGYLGGIISNPFGGGGLTSAPFNQCAGVYDYDSNNILYYNRDTLWGESRADLTDITPVALTGVSLANVYSAALIYTGCSGKEIGLYDYIDKKLYLFNKSTGVLAHTVNLPSSTPINSNSTHNYGLGYANDLLWIYGGTNIWVGFNISDEISVGLGDKEGSAVSAYPNPTKDKINFSTAINVQLTNVTGQVITERKNVTSLDISSQPQGIYLILVSDNDGQIVKRLNVMKN